jgi:outer membrane biosynthesis protein TonB
MTSLICLVCRCNLKDRRLIKENEPFETDAAEAEILVRGGIAKRVEKPVEPEPVKETVKARVVEKPPEPKYTQVYEPEPEPEPEKKIDKRRKR